MSGLLIYISIQDFYCIETGSDRKNFSCMACIISCLEGQEPAERFGCNGFCYGLKAGGAQIFGLHNQEE